MDNARKFSVSVQFSYIITYENILIPKIPKMTADSGINPMKFIQTASYIVHWNIIGTSIKITHCMG